MQKLESNLDTTLVISDTENEDRYNKFIAEQKDKSKVLNFKLIKEAR